MHFQATNHPLEGLEPVENFFLQRRRDCKMEFSGHVHPELNYPSSP